MISLIQLVTHAAVSVENQCIAKIDHGIVALIGIEKEDTEINAFKLIDRIIHYRIFKDNEGKTNLSLKSVEGGLLLVPQFTLVADTNKGTRPGFSNGMRPEAGMKLFTTLVNHAKNSYVNVQSGQFGAHMQVSLCNDGPMTFILSQ